jgi:hypothetical protein
MKNQTALPSLTVNPSNVLPSLPPSLSPPPLLSPPSLLPSLSPPFTLGRTHPRSAEAGRGAPTPSRRATHSSSHGHHKRSTRDPPGRTGRRLDGGAGGGWQEQGFGVTASLTRSRGERPWEAIGTTSIARIAGSMGTQPPLLPGLGHSPARPGSAHRGGQLLGAQKWRRGTFS